MGQVVMPLGGALSSLCSRFAQDLSLDLSQVLEGALRGLLNRYEGALGSAPDVSFRRLLGNAGAFSQDAASANFKVGFETEAGEADLALSVQPAPDGDGLFCFWGYSSDLFDPSTVERIHRDYSRLLTAWMERPDAPMSEPSLLAEDEREQIVRLWNDTQREYPRDASIPELFEQVAIQHARRIAVADPLERLSYEELNIRASALAAQLLQQGVQPGARVGLALERSVPMVVSMLAVLKCGAAYVPLDAGYPAERLQFMIGDAALSAIIADAGCRERLAGQVPCFSLEQLPPVAGGPPQPAVKTAAESTAYIMYTSGSTGTPKGVEVLHRGIVRLVRNAGYVDFGPDQVFAQVSNACFDAITFEVWGALLNGGRLVILPTRVVLSPEAFAAAIQEHGITAMFLTSSLFNFVAARCPHAFRTVRHLLVGGDAVDPRWARHVLETAPPGKLINGYGPTECTTFSVTHHIREVPADAVTVPIGRPLANSLAYVLDAALRPVPAGVPGELYLGGDGLARGYWNRPDLTRERFVPSPFDPMGQARLYKTGDLARYRKDGVIECLGRVDHQVKIRGFRIELGEIETVLRRHPLVRDCVAVALDNQRLIAYVATGAGSRPHASSLRQFLGERLPEFMLPSAFQFLEELPLTANGKVDRDRLPRFEAAIPDSGHTGAPLTETQASIALAWKNSLEIQRVGLDDNFFDIGGDSLRMAAVECELKTRFEQPFCLVDLFEHPTIRALAEWFTEPKNERNLISDAQDRARRQQAGLGRMRAIPRGA